MQRSISINFATILLMITMMSCSKDSSNSKSDENPGDNTSTETSTSTSTTSSGTGLTAPDCSNGTEKSDMASDVPDWIKKNFTCVAVSVSGANLQFKTKDLPSFKSYYYGSSSDRYEALPSGNHGNPNKIQSQSLTLSIPSSPAVAASTTATSLGAIGVTVKGTLLYNNEAAPGDSLTNELVTMDQSNGHPTATGQYHHHTEPTKISSDNDALVGILLDGFPVYGKKDEDGSYPSDLDASNGHTHATKLFPSGIYHYHITDNDPYICGSYKGKPGSITK